MCVLFYDANSSIELTDACAHLLFTKELILPQENFNIENNW